jgi:hypothetical protein
MRISTLTRNLSQKQGSFASSQGLGFNFKQPGIQVIEKGPICLITAQPATSTLKIIFTVSISTKSAASKGLTFRVADQMQIAVNSRLPTVNVFLGEAANVAKIAMKCMFDTGAAVSSGSKPYHLNIMKQHLELVHE